MRQNFITNKIIKIDIFITKSLQSSKTLILNSNIVYDLKILYTYTCLNIIFFYYYILFYNFVNLLVIIALFYAEWICKKYLYKISK